MSKRGYAVFYPQHRIDGHISSAYYLGSSKAEITPVVARGVLQVIRDAYTARFEAPAGPLPTGTVGQRFKPMDVGAVRMQQHRMLGAIYEGSEYWIAYDNAGKNDIAALAKISPNQNNVYFNDIIVSPPYQKKSYGTLLAHAALKFGAARNDANVELEAFTANPAVNEWFKDGWGMRPEELSPEGFEIGGHVLEQQRYASPEDLCVQGIVRAFEDRAPGLTSGRIFNA